MQRFIFYALTLCSFMNYAGIQSQKNSMLSCVSDNTDIQDIIWGYLDEFTYVSSIAVSKSSIKKIFFIENRLVACNEQNKLICFDPYSMNQESIFQLDHIRDIAPLNCGNKLVVLAQKEEPLEIRDYEGKKFVELVDVKTKSKTVQSIQASKNGKLLALVLRGELQIVDTKTEAYLAKLTKQRISTCTFSPDDTCIAFGSINSGVKIWNMQTGLVSLDSQKTEFTPKSISYSPTGEQLIAAGYELWVLWNAHTGEKIYEMADKHWDTTQVVFAPLRKLCALCRYNNVTHVSKIDIIDLSPALAGYKKMKECKKSDFKNIFTVALSNTKINGITFSSNGNGVYAGCDNGQLHLWRSGIGNLVNQEQVTPELKESKTESGCIIC